MTSGCAEKYSLNSTSSTSPSLLLSIFCRNSRPEDEDDEIEEEDDVGLELEDML
ncbi:MAG: hypothetical protein ACPIOQ_65185 [Promethearchaeia archaeon]